MKKLLVIVDMQNDFVTGCLGTKKAAEIAVPIAEYAERFVSEDGEVVFTRDTHQEYYLETLEGRNLPVTHCIEGTNGWEIVPELQGTVEKYSKMIFDKPSFGSLALGEFIAMHWYDEVEFCGVCTGICVISNALMAKAYAPETNIKVVEDLCACVTPESHATAINAMKTCQVEIVRSDR